MTDKKAKPVIVFPVWHQLEIENFLWLLDRWNTITHTDSKYDFVVVQRFDAPDATSVVNSASRYADVHHLRLPFGMTGHPHGCNDMWYKTLLMSEFFVEPDSFFFWYESDVMAQNTRWLDILIDAWRSDYMVMGHWIDQEWLDKAGYKPSWKEHWGPHINGAACYNPKLIEKAKDIPFNQKAWDVQLVRFLTPETYMGLRLYDMRFTLNEGIDKLAEDHSYPMIHGLKTVSEKQERIKVFGV